MKMELVPRLHGPAGFVPRRSLSPLHPKSESSAGLFLGSLQSTNMWLCLLRRLPNLRTLQHQLILSCMFFES